MGVDPSNLLEEAAEWHRRRSQREEAISPNTDNPFGSSEKCPPLLTTTGEDSHDEDGDQTNLKSKPDPYPWSAMWLQWMGIMTPIMRDIYISDSIAKLGLHQPLDLVEMSRN